MVDYRLLFTTARRSMTQTVARDLLENPPASLAGKFDGAQVRLAPNFYDDPRLAHLISKLAKKALQNSA